MQDVFSIIQNLGSNYESSKELNEFFQSKFDVLGANTDAVLKLLRVGTNPQTHSLVQLWLMSALVSNNKSALLKQINHSELYQLYLHYFENFVPDQVQSQFSRLFQLASQFTDQLLSEKKAIYGIKTLQDLIFKIRDNKEQVCGSLHKEFAKLCIKAKCYQHALVIVKDPITNFKKQTQPMDILNYVYYRGIIFTALKDYHHAIESFKIIISFPSQCTHKIHVESYKKLVILNLIQNGKMAELPKYTSMILKHKLETNLQLYKNLANFFVNKDDNQFNQIIEKNQEEFMRDNNLGLIKKLIKIYQRKRIQELSETYLTLRYTEMKNAVRELQDQNHIEQTLFEMINNDQIHAKIDSEKAMITFIDTTSQSTGGIDESKENEYLAVIEELEQQNQRIIKLMNYVQSADSSLQTSNQLIKRTLFGKSGGANYDVSGGDMI
eukprot:403368654